MDFRAARDRSFLGDGGSHRCPQGSSGCDGQLLDLCVQTSDHPLHRLATLRTDNHNQPERIILYTSGCVSMHSFVNPLKGTDTIESYVILLFVLLMCFICIFLGLLF